MATKEQLQAKVKQLTESRDYWERHSELFLKEKEDLSSEFDDLMTQNNLLQADNDRMVKIIGALTVKVDKHESGK